MNLAQYCSYWAAMRGDEPAAVFRGESLSWAELERRANALAASLTLHGLRQGDRMGCLLNNCLEWVVVWCAALKAGVILVPLNPRYGDAELREIVTNVGCRALVAMPGDVGRIAPSVAQRANAPGTIHLFALQTEAAPVAFTDAIAGNARPPSIDVRPDDIAVVTFTSGSTGLPKGAMLSHRAIRAMGMSSIAANRFTSNERVLLLAPFAFTGGIISVYSPTYLAGGCIYIDESADPERALATITSQRITAITGVPILWERMADSRQFATADLSSLNSAATGGAPVSPALLQRYTDKGVRIRQVYGCTEASGLISTPADVHALAKPWACGVPLPTVEVRVVDAAGAPCATGEVGELLLRGEQMFSGYWGNDAASAEAWLDGWYRTGDLGRIDEAGHIQITDRKKNMVISGGVNIYPAEIERAMSALGGVIEVVAFGMPDASWGERVVAVVHAAGGLDARALMRETRTALGAYKTPKEIIVVNESLPRTSTGKLQRAKFAQLYESLRDAPRVLAGELSESDRSSISPAT
ncbi:class I adenylate-forming enzyme family protein [Paraburkholderia bannensis]|uniref:class I adenylate-forming enzyme family protein n=1 Tax=Paraburkholderia bannensis TaxID=765414 RepID=UPI002AC33F1B|nr:AMP-binding protein [Paraburkholderia bannensis]